MTDEIKFGRLFDQPIGQGILPDMLKSIEFGHDFNKPIKPNVLPNSLERIRFGCKFSQPIKPSVLPNSLKSIVFSASYDQTIHENVSPNDLNYISFGYNAIRQIGPNVLPDSLIHVAIMDSSIDQISIRCLPDSVGHIKLYCGSPLDIECSPQNLKVLETINGDILKLLSSQNIYLTVIYRDCLGVIIDIDYQILCTSDSHLGAYERTGTYVVDGENYTKLINPIFYQPRSIAKSARK